jgi:hypothetical protein
LALPKLNQVGTYRSTRVALKSATLSKNARVSDLFQLGVIEGWHEAGTIVIVRI